MSSSTTGDADAVMAAREADLKKALKQYDYVRFIIADFYGTARCRVVPRGSFLRMFRDGIGIYCGIVGFGLHGEAVIDAEKVPSVAAARFGNVLMMPQTGTLVPVPWAGTSKYKVGQVLCETIWPTTKQPQLECSRYITRRQLQRLEQHGLELFSGFEVELMLFVADSKEPIFKLATVAAGLDGLNSKLSLPVEMEAAAKMLPRTLQDAIKALQEDKVMVEALGQEFVNFYCLLKTDVELKELGADDSIHEKEDISKEWDMYHDI